MRKLDLVNISYGLMLGHEVSRTDKTNGHIHSNGYIVSMISKIHTTFPESLSDYIST